MLFHFIRIFLIIIYKYNLKLDIKYSEKIFYQYAIVALTKYSFVDIHLLEGHHMMITRLII